MKLRSVQVTLMLALLGLAGCGGIQDSTQPPANSISAGPKSDLPPVKAKGAFKSGPVQKGH